MTNLAHYLGLAGESANFAGAILLSYDLSSRIAHERAKELAIAFSDRAKANLEILLPSVDEPIRVGTGTDPVRQIERIHILVVSRLTRIGLKLLAFGFALLAIYHVLGIVD